MASSAVINICPWQLPICEFKYRFCQNCRQDWQYCRLARCHSITASRLTALNVPKVFTSLTPLNRFELNDIVCLSPENDTMPIYACGAIVTFLPFVSLSNQVKLGYGCNGNFANIFRATTP